MNTEDTSLKRRTVKPVKSPNPLFEQWLEEWRIEAANKNSDLQYCYKHALNSLRKYPLQLNSGTECLILKNFGKQLCSKLDKKLAEYKQNNEGQTLFPPPSSKPNEEHSAVRQNLTKGCKRKKPTPSTINSSQSNTSPRKKKPYVPAPRSGAHAILVALNENRKSTINPGFMRKMELIDKAEAYCDTSFKTSENNNYYSAWSSMASLIGKGLVTKSGNPAKYSLTKEGEDLASKLLHESIGSSSFSLPLIPCTNNSPSKLLYKVASATEFSSGISSLKLPNSSKLMSSTSSTQSIEKKINFSPSKLHSQNIADNSNCIDLTEEDDIQTVENRFSCKDSSASSSKMKNSSSQNLPNSDLFEQLIFTPGEFEIILLVDLRETSGKIKNPMNDDTIRDLTNLNTKFETRHLNIGDFLWIARNQNKDELLLPYIVERKRMDDLGSSIKDGRFHEQKFRLHKCGLENITFLIEKFGKEKGLGLPVNTLHQAIVNTQLVDKFFVKVTNNHSHSMMYLSVFTKLLAESFKEKTLISCSKKNLPPFDFKADIVSLMTFTEFSKSSVKNKVLKIHEMFLKQLVQLNGLSVEKAAAIIQKYPAPRDLIKAFEIAEKPDMLLSNVPYGLTKRNIGPTISKTIYKLYTSEYFE